MRVRSPRALCCFLTILFMTLFNGEVGCGRLTCQSGGGDYTLVRWCLSMTQEGYVAFACGIGELARRSSVEHLGEGSSAT